MLNLAKKLWEEEGQGMAEYSLILGIIAFAVVAVLTLIQGSLIQVYYLEAVSLISGILEP